MRGSVVNTMWLNDFFSLDPKWPRVMIRRWVLKTVQTIIERCEVGRVFREQGSVSFLFVVFKNPPPAVHGFRWAYSPPSFRLLSLVDPGKHCAQLSGGSIPYDRLTCQSNNQKSLPCTQTNQGVPPRVTTGFLPLTKLLFTTIATNLAIWLANLLICRYPYLQRYPSSHAVVTMCCELPRLSSSSLFLSHALSFARPQLPIAWNRLLLRTQECTGKKIQSG